MGDGMLLESKSKQIICGGNIGLSPSGMKSIKQMKVPFNIFLKEGKPYISAANDLLVFGLLLLLFYFI